MGARPSPLNTTAMTARMVPLLIKTILAPVVIVTVIRLVSPDPLLLGQIPQSNYRNASTSAAGLYLSRTAIQWLILRNYLVVGGLLADYYRALAWAVAEVTMVIGIGSGTVIDTGGDDDFLMHAL